MRQHIHEVLADGDAASANTSPSGRHTQSSTPTASRGRARVPWRAWHRKGAFGKAMMKLFGQHGIRTQGAAVLDSRFNVHLRDCVLLFADEVDWDSRRVPPQLKGMTEPSLFIEPKGVDATNQPKLPASSSRIQQRLGDPWRHRGSGALRPSGCLTAGWATRHTSTPCSVRWRRAGWPRCCMTFWRWT